MNALTLARFKARISQAELAERSNVAQSTISNIESGKHRASDQTLFALADVLKVDPMELAGQLRSNRYGSRAGTA
jgi:transcriptional regulator with XRE-family HTH domain